MTRPGLAARIASLRHARTLRGRYDAALAQTAPWSDERDAVEAAYDDEVDRRIDARREDRRGGGRHADDPG